jgi:hypothetical protein
MAIRQHAGHQLRNASHTPHGGTPDRQAKREELIRLLNDDFARECQGVYAYAVYAEKYRDSNPAAAAACEDHGHREVAHALALCQLVYDYGGSLTARVDDAAAVRRAARVARPGWLAETVRRLRERADQLRAAGRPHLANRLTRLIDHKQAGDGLAGIVRRYPGCGANNPPGR